MSTKNEFISPKQGYIPALDGIRAIAILLVLFSHSVIFDQFTQLHDIGLQMGYTGVSIFFVLSGYLITRSLIQEENKFGRISLKFFYIRRVLRLLPALWAYLIVAFCLWLAHLLPDNPWHSFVTSFLYIRNLIGHGNATDHLWSLSIEEQFYFLWPIIIIKFPYQNRRRLIIALIIIAIVGFWRCYAIANNYATAGDIYIRTDFRLDSPLMGCALALIERKNVGTHKLNIGTLNSDILIVISILSISLWTFIQTSTNSLIGISSTFVSLISCLIIYSQIFTHNSRFGSILTSPILNLIGKISYGTYLWQALFLAPTSEPLGFLRIFPLNLLLCFLCGLVSYYIIEKPFLKIKYLIPNPVIKTKL
jgi:peptidoglycan/LPS O-acetylase OafA/YrhL